MANVFSETELASMVNEASRYLDTICEIRRLVSTPDLYGGVKEEWKTISSTFCRLSAVTPYGVGEFETNDSIRNESLRLVSLPLNTDIQLDDRLVINHHEYAIVGIVDTSIKICLHLQCRMLGS